MHQSYLLPFSSKPGSMDRVAVAALAGVGAAACVGAVGLVVHAAWKRAMFRPLAVTLVPETTTVGGGTDGMRHACKVVVCLKQWGVRARVSQEVGDPAADAADGTAGTVVYHLPANQSEAAAAAYAALVLFAEAPALPLRCARLLDLVPSVQQQLAPVATGACMGTDSGSVCLPAWTPASPAQRASWDSETGVTTAAAPLALSWAPLAAGKVYDMTALAACKPFMQALVALCRCRLKALGATVLVAYSHTSSTLAAFVAQACGLRLVVVRKVTVGGPLDVPVPGPQEKVNNSASVEHSSTLQLWMEGLRGDDVPVLFEAVKNSGGVLTAMGSLVRRTCVHVHELVLIDFHHPDDPARSLLATPLPKKPWTCLWGSV